MINSLSCEFLKQILIYYDCMVAILDMEECLLIKKRSIHDLKTVKSLAARRQQTSLHFIVKDCQVQVHLMTWLAGLSYKLPRGYQME